MMTYSDRLLMPRSSQRPTLLRGALSVPALAVTLVAASAGQAIPAPPAAAQTRELRWASDPEGGAPYVEADPNDPTKLTGFDVEIAGLLARGLGRTPRFLYVAFQSMDQAVARGDADIGLCGLEDTPASRAAIAVTIPYYEVRERPRVREAEAGRLKTLADFRGKRVATLAGTIAYEILLNAQRKYGIEAVSYDDDVHPYSDLEIGRVDGVLLDNVLA